MCSHLRFHCLYLAVVHSPPMGAGPGSRWGSHFIGRKIKCGRAPQTWPHPSFHRVQTLNWSISHPKLGGLVKLLSFEAPWGSPAELRSLKRWNKCDCSPFQVWCGTTKNSSNRSRSIRRDPDISGPVCWHSARSSKQVGTLDYNLKGGSNTRVNDWLCRLSTSHSRNHLNEAEPAVWQDAT